MSEEMSGIFPMVLAASCFEGLPDDLSALLICQRPTTRSTVRVCTVGDIGLSGRAAATAHRRGSDVLLSEVAPLLRTADVAFGNLEFPLTTECGSGAMFAAPVTGATTLKEAGFGILHLANNHVGEYGQDGLATTLGAVRGADLVPLGAGDDAAAACQLVVTEIRNLRIGWLGCGRTLLPQAGTGPRYWEFNEQELLDAVLSARRKVDLLVVSVHTGLMYMDYPRPEDKVMAERLMNGGANLIIMHHAHVLQGVQITQQGCVCCYNLGNFLYDWSVGNVQTPVQLRAQNEGGIFWFELDDQGVVSAKVLPTWIDDDCRVRWATGDRGIGILSRLNEISAGLTGAFEPIFEAQRASRNTGPILKVLAFHARRGNWKFVVESLRRARWQHCKMVGRWLAGLVRGTA
jgi:capsule synthesis protein PGA_cap